jgi:hypothetical protein
MNAAQIIYVFNSLFSESCNTRLSGGFSEPFYKAARRPHDVHEIQYREDFVSSALHEIAHWCLAGSLRRTQDDYGYWYIKDRCKDQQEQFEQVEAKPQGLEWILSIAAGVDFRVSCDNFDVKSSDTTLFRRLVRQQAVAQIEAGLLQRTRQLADALTAISGEAGYINDYHYKGLPK